MSCPSHLCGLEVDSLDHAKSCHFLETRFDARRMSHPMEFAKYLVNYVMKGSRDGDCVYSDLGFRIEQLFKIYVFKLNARSNISFYLSW